ncbi:MAG: hypothetical protein HBSAPP01_22700 [Candidatus Brocadia sapporoensis]|nr:MAG: hypothetical protein HBSAPP01_22700 [Candidatus Brocadia sapporoensis]
MCATKLIQYGSSEKICASKFQFNMILQNMMFIMIEVVGVNIFKNKYIC